MVNIMLHLFDLQSRNMYKPCKTCWTRSCCNREKNKIPNIKAKECSRCPRGSNYRLYYIFALNFYNWVETNALDEALAGVARSTVLTLSSGRFNMSCALTDVMIWPYRNKSQHLCVCANWSAVHIKVTLWDVYLFRFIYCTRRTSTQYNL